MVYRPAFETAAPDADSAFSSAETVSFLANFAFAAKRAFAAKEARLETFEKVGFFGAAAGTTFCFSHALNSSFWPEGLFYEEL